MHPANCTICAIAGRLRALSVDERAAALDGQPAQLIESIAAHWPIWSRPEQRLPGGDWTYWLIKAGRGWGKSRTGAETVRKWIADGHRQVNLIGATADDARDIMIEGESGILAICPPAERPQYLPSKRRLEWPNGAKSLIFTADEPDRLRGKQHGKIWCDELAAWRYADAWDQAKFGLRLGDHPQAIITTTPRPTRIVREIMADPSTVVTHGATQDNADNLPEAYLHAILSKYAGTRIGRQEIDGDILDDNPGALFTRADIDAGRREDVPQLRRIVVAIDPAVTSNEESDDTGIIVAGVATVGGIEHGYILDDLTCHLTPDGWGRRAINAYRHYQADRIIGESNNGGDLIETVLRAIDRDVSYTRVTATRGKAIRAEPVAALYEQGRIHHIGSLAALEDEMCSWDPADSTAASPNRLDALVWAITHLMLGESGGLTYG